MHGGTAEINRRNIGPHMWSIPSRGSTAVAALSDSSSAKSFVKDGRMIKIGDCALFKSPHESPPFIGIIHELTSASNDRDLKLLVSWLYRPGEVELSEGDAISAAPNEVFYSFHRDETPPASLLHPCKVAFLPKGVELPSGVSSFVCRRVYDITNRCLWWLTDKDFLNVHQEEIDKLLQKSRLEMHTTVQQQQGTHCPKPVNVGTSSSPSKHSADSMQGGSNICSSQCKAKKRELSAQTSEPVKRQRRTEDADATLLRSDSTLKSEIVQAAGRGGLLNSEAVERLVQLMLSENSQRKIDLSIRAMLAGIIAATDNFDCLNQFVQSKGLPILDEWLKEVHKGKVGDLSGLKESEKSVEDFLFVLLRALDKLPVNLESLQMCNIGKSVNHLRSHKNTEIQKKSRSLVDRWKKRVEAEMSSNEPKSPANQSVSCLSRSRHDATHAGYKDNGGGGPVDSATRGSPHGAPLKSSSAKHVHTKALVESSGVQRSPSSPVLAATCSKEEQPKISVAGNGGSELPQTTVEDKSSSSSQSHTNSPSSSGRAKNAIPSGKDDARRSTARSKSAQKNSGFSRHRRSTNDLQGAAPVAQKESGNTRNYFSSKVLAAEKFLSLRTANDDAQSMPVTDSNSHKVIVKVVSRGRNSPGLYFNPAVVDPSFKDKRASSPDLSDAQTVLDNLRDKTSPLHSNNEYDGLPVAASDEMLDKSDNDIISHLDVPKVVKESSTKDTQLKKSVDSSLNALIDSCVKYSEAIVSSVPVGDDSELSLLACVAAGEMSVSSTSVRKAASAADKSIVVYKDTKQSNGTSSIEPPSAQDGVLEQKGNFYKTNGKMKTAVDDLLSSSPPVCVAGKNDGGGQNLSMGVPTVKDENHDPVSESRYVTSHSSVLPQDSVKTETPIGNDPETVQEDLLAYDQRKSDEINDNGVSMEKLPSLLGTSESLSKKDGQVGSPGDLVPNAPFELSSENVKESCDLVVEDEKLRTKEENKTLSSIISKVNPGCSEQIGICKGEMMEKQSSISHSEAAVGQEEDVLGGSTARASSPRTTQVSDSETKLGFDLNEGLSMDDAEIEESVNMRAQFAFSTPLASSSFSTSGPVGIHASVTVAAAAAKGPFVPLEDLLKNRMELGWKGSAATSAFRPAEPRRALEVPINTNGQPLHTSTNSDRPVFDFDLNVTDEKLLQDVGCQRSAQKINCFPDKKNGGLELDLNLNQVDDGPELDHHLHDKNIEVPLFPVKPSPFGGSLQNVASAKWDFDLNDGPSTDEANPESSLAHNSSFHGNFTPTGNFPQWYSPGTTYSAITAPLALSGSGVGPPQRMLGGPTTSSVSPELYCGPILTSSPAMPLATTSFHYPVFPFRSNFPLPTSSLPGSSTAAYVDSSSGGHIYGPPIPTQLMGAASVSSPCFRPSLFSSPEISSNAVVDSSRKWGRQGLDLNCGPSGVDIEGSSASRQLPVVGKHTLVAEDHPRAFHLAGGGAMKRKEPEGGLDAERMRYKQPSWQ